jgi:hypothetical protein
MCSFDGIAVRPRLVRSACDDVVVLGVMLRLSGSIISGSYSTELLPGRERSTPLNGVAELEFLCELFCTSKRLTSNVPPILSLGWALAREALATSWYV